MITIRFRRQRPLIVAPAHFPPEFRSTWQALVDALGPLATPSRAHEIEVATMLLVELRTIAPDRWPLSDTEPLARFCMRCDSRDRDAPTST